jgi:guanylate kinase
MVIVISGPSGVGKSTVCHRLCDRLPAEFSVSVTTRRPRPGEQPSRDYEYVDKGDFDRLRNAGGLLEWAEVYGQWYGTPMAPVQRALDDGRTVILEIDINGCRQVREKIPGTRAFFLLPPTLEEQRQRIEGRRTDDPETIERRLAKADGEIRYASDSECYDAFIVNGDLEETVSKIIESVSAACGPPSQDHGANRS